MTKKELLIHAIILLLFNYLLTNTIQGTLLLTSLVMNIVLFKELFLRGSER